MKAKNWFREYCEQIGDRRQEQGYLKAADELVDKLIHQPDAYHRDRDGLSYPILFIYRHYLEISLKRVIRVYMSLDCSHVNFSRILDGHNLSSLWARVSSFMEKYYPDFHRCKGVKILDAVVKWFHCFDPDSYVSRYSHTTQRRGRKRTRTLIPPFNPAVLRKNMREVARLLDFQNDVIQMVEQRREDEYCY